MINGRDFIITSLQTWDIEIGSTIKNTALALSKQNRVFYISTPMDYMTWFRGENNAPNRHRKDVVNGRTPAIRQINDNMWVIDCPFILYPVNRLPSPALFDLVNKRNNKRIAARILEIVKQFAIKDFIHFIDTDIYRSFYLKELIQPALSIYYCRDYLISKPYWKQGIRLEPLLAAKSDMVIANSPLMAQRFHPYNSRCSFVETGVTLTLYDASKRWPVLEDMQTIPSPVIGYVGSINSRRLDCELIYNVAKERPQYNFAMVGPEDEYFANHPIHQLSNVYFLGRKPVEMLPAYINSFDVCHNFQIVNDITDGNYPLKIDEYLAMGKPTVATSTHTMRELFSEYVFLPVTKDEYLQSIDTALAQKNDEALREKRIHFAQSHSWENVTNKMLSIIQTLSHA